MKSKKLIFALTLTICLSAAEQENNQDNNIKTHIIDALRGIAGGAIISIANSLANKIDFHPYLNDQQLARRNDLNYHLSWLLYYFYFANLITDSNTSLTPSFSGISKRLIFGFPGYSLGGVLTNLN